MSCHTSSRVGTLLNAKAFAESNNLLRKELNIFVDKKKLDYSKAQQKQNNILAYQKIPYMWFRENKLSSSSPQKVSMMIEHIILYMWDLSRPRI